MSTTIDLSTISIDDLGQINTIQELSEWTKGCHACSLRAAGTQVVHADGDPTSPIMLVGMNPAFAEDGSMIPFCGREELLRSHCMQCEHAAACYSWFTGATSSKLVSKCKGFTPRSADAKVLTVPEKTKVNRFTVNGIKTAGQILDDMLVTLGINRRSIYITNGALCGSTSTTPRAENYNSCARIRIRTEQLVNPKVIITLGRDPLKLYSGKTQTMSQVHGVPFTYRHQTQSITVVPTYHPASILRSMQNAEGASLEGLEAIKLEVKNLKLSLINDFATAFNLLSHQELLKLVSDPNVLVNNKLPLRI